MRQEQYLLGLCKNITGGTIPDFTTREAKFRTGWMGAYSPGGLKSFHTVSLWRRINFIGGDNQKNPVGRAARKVGAKSRANSVKYYSNKDLKEIRHYCRNVTVNSINISKNLYNEVSNTIISPTGRIHKNPQKRLTDILNLFLSGESLKQHRDWRKIYESYDTWYKVGSVPDSGS